MKIVVFGAGKFYQEREAEFLSYKNIEPIAFIDNNRDLHGTSLSGIPIFAVEQLELLNFDIILLMSSKADEMKIQLLEYGVDVQKIWYWEKFRSEQNQGIIHFYYGNRKRFLEGKNILIITTNLNYNGGTLAAVYAAKELQKRRYHVILAAPGGNSVFIEEMKKSGLDIAICSAFPYLYQEELSFIEQFDAVFVNVFQMILCASEISKIKPVIWWIHEPSDLYDSIINQFHEYAAEEKLEKIHIYAVSRIPRKNFNNYFPNRITKILNYGIPDERKTLIKNSKNDKVIFAIIGSVVFRKGQDIFLQAIKKLKAELNSDSSFWIIGKLGMDSYCDEVRELAKELSVSILGEMTREEIQNSYQDIDVLVCPSREDPLPIVVTEAMMFGKVCIVSDLIGTTDYIVEKKNGLIFKTENADDLSQKMKWALQNKEKLQQIGYHARRTYEENFTMEEFGDRLEQALRYVL